ncbi:MAG: hypothetical protein PHS93_05490 [Candidatus Omnitrophica bacterium]|nr:hypothetical protein [Candidatus Omnitrophota bacterium]MDD5352603.1 hypothetical protein [Candidatus Omnitrophota bacterium]MDD5550201.1 hypothetical protein [Candidatus Omnitrophota bacterium]
MKGRRAFRVILTIAILILGIILVKALFADGSFTAAATCYMPQYVTLANGEKVLADSINNGNNQNNQINVPEVNKEEIEEDAIAENASALIQQQEEVVLEDGLGLITTVFAR